RLAGATRYVVIQLNGAARLRRVWRFVTIPIIPSRHLVSSPTARRRWGAETGGNQAMTHQEPLAAASCAELSEAFSAHAPVVWRVLRRHGVDNDSLEDGTHDVFVIAQRKWHTFE